MSDNLRKHLNHLITLSKAKLAYIRKYIKKANRNFVRVLSEIAYNIVQGVVKCKKYTKTKLVKTLADKNAKYALKQKLLRTLSAAEIIKSIIVTVIPILRTIT